VTVRLWDPNLTDGENQANVQLGQHKMPVSGLYYNKGLGRKNAGNNTEIVPICCCYEDTGSVQHTACAFLM